MRVRSLCAALPLASALLGALPAYADFPAALSEYQAGHYELAHAQFLALAELGDCASQFNLAAMALQGQGGPKDSGSGVGWLRAAAENGCERLVGNRLPALTARLSTQDARAAAEIVTRYGHQALKEQGILEPELVCRDETPASVLQSPQPEYPHLAGGPAQGALVIVRLTVGSDGLARDPEVLLAVPAAAFAAAAVESWFNSQFRPAMRGARAVASQLQAKSAFAGEGAAKPADLPPLKGARPAADAGDPAAGYLVGLAAMLDGSFGISSERAGQLLIESARGGDARAQYWIGSQLHDTAACHPQADGSVWLRHAAAGGSAAARLLLATDLLRATPSAAQAAQARELLEQAASSDDYYVSKHVTALLAASPVAAVRDPTTALRVADRLLAGEIHSDPQMFEAVAAAYAANADFQRAAAQQQAAIARARSLGWDTSAMSERLTAYRAGRSWSGDLLTLPPAAATRT